MRLGSRRTKVADRRPERTRDAVRPIARAIGQSGLLAWIEVIDQGAECVRARLDGERLRSRQRRQRVRFQKQVADSSHGRRPRPDVFAGKGNQNVVIATFVNIEGQPAIARDLVEVPGQAGAACPGTPENGRGQRLDACQELTRLAGSPNGAGRLPHKSADEGGLTGPQQLGRIRGRARTCPDTMIDAMAKPEPTPIEAPIEATQVEQPLTMTRAGHGPDRGGKRRQPMISTRCVRLNETRRAGTAPQAGCGRELQQVAWRSATKPSSHLLDIG